MAEKWNECGYAPPEKPVEENPSRSPSDTAITKIQRLGDRRASLTMEEAQYLGERVKKNADSQ